MVSNLPHSNIKEYHSNCKNVLPHTEMAGRDKNDITNGRTICQQNRIAFSQTAVVVTVTRIAAVVTVTGTAAFVFPC
jgi:hypothetical protein